jgi:hypothetical protein
MKKKIISLLFTSVACGQSLNKTEKVKTDQIKNQTVKKALDALQNADDKVWFSLFTDNAELYDDGRKKNFRNFFTKAIGHERFTSIDKIENNSLEIYGKFHSDLWGDFKTYIKFQVDEKDKITRLNIGQADY